MTNPQDVFGSLTSALSAYTEAQASAINTATEIAAETEATPTEGTEDQSGGE